MNMQKLGIVSSVFTSYRSLIIFNKFKHLNLMHYTLCEVQKPSRWTSSRNGFAFYRMQILRDGGRTGRYCGRASAAARFLCTVLVTTVHLSQFETLRSLRNSLVASVVRGLQRFVPPKTTIPAFSFWPVCFRTLETTETTKSFSERACAAIPQGRRECVGVAEKSLVRSGSEGSEAPPLPTKPFLTFGGCYE